MRSRLRLVLGFWAFLLSSEGCSVLTSFEGLSDRYGSPVVDADDGGSGGEAFSASGNGGGAGGITPTNGSAGSQGGQAGGEAGQSGAARVRMTGNVTSCDPIGLSSPSWAIRNDAKSIANQYFELTPNTIVKRGAVWWKNAVVFDEFDVSFDFRVSPRWASSSGTGFTFAWVNTSAPPGNATYGFTLGLSQVPGWALALDTVAPTEFPRLPYLRLVDGTSNSLANGTEVIGVTVAEQTFPLNADWIPIRLIFDGKIFSVQNGDSVVFSVTVDGYRPFRGYWGFSGATNDHLKEQHAIRNIRLFFPYDKGCLRLVVITKTNAIKPRNLSHFVTVIKHVRGHSTWFRVV